MLVLPAMASRRLSNQIGRAFRGTYGAEAGLRMLMCDTARQLLAHGATPHSVERALEHCVLGHPDRPAGAIKPMSDAVDSATLVRLTRKCVADVARELGEYGIRP